MQQQRRSFLEWLPDVVATSTMSLDKYIRKINPKNFVDKKITYQGQKQGLMFISPLQPID